MAIDAVTSRISDIQGRMDMLAQSVGGSRGGIMGQGIVSVPGMESTSAAAATGQTSTSSATSLSSSEFTSALAKSLESAGIDSSAIVSSLSAAGTADGSNLLAQQVLDKAREWIGTPYKWGGNTKDGVDCSGLVKEVLAEFGIDMPRVARQQMNEGTKVDSLEDAKPGDLLVFNNGTHIGFYVGNGKMIDAPIAGDHVRERAIYETPTQIRRVIPEIGNTDSTEQTSLAQSTYTTLGAADLLDMNASSRTSFDLMSALSTLGVSA